MAFIPEEGDNLVRILPALRPIGSAFLKVTRHDYYDGRGWTPFACPPRRRKNSCFFCDEAIPLLTQLGERGQELAHDLRPKERVLCNILGRSYLYRGPQIWDLPRFLYTEILVIKVKHGDITDLETGCDLVLTRTGKGLETRYSLRVSQDSEKVDSDILSDLIDLEKVYIPHEYQKEEFRQWLGGRIRSLRPRQVTFKFSGLVLTLDE